MAEVRWTPQAADDLEAITDFIATDSPHYASLFVIDVFSAIERIQMFPRSGRVVPEAQSADIREIVLGNYRVVYRLQNDAVVVLTVWHGSRLLDPSRLT